MADELKTMVQAIKATTIKTVKHYNFFNIIRKGKNDEQYMFY